jgi:hypothetical protein
MRPLAHRADAAKTFDKRVLAAGDFLNEHG